MISNDVTLPLQQKATNVNEEDTNDVSSLKKKTQKWSMLRDVVSSTVESSFTSRNGTSMTKQETSFLSLLEKSKREKRLSPLKTSANLGFAHVVPAAVAREKLRNDLSNRLSKLTAIEAQFLRDLVESEDVTAEQLNNADHRLNTDPLYQLSEEEIERKKSVDSETHICVDHLELEFSQEERDGLEMENKSPLKRDRHYVQIVANEIEVSLSPKNHHKISECRSTTAAKVIPTGPSKYSYRTCEMMLLQDKAPDFPILGLCDNIAEKDRILSPPMMDSLRKHLPFAVSEDNFWMKYNMSRDGASTHSLYNSVRQSSRTLIAIETTNGEVFGAFVSSPWRNSNTFYGSCEAFLWRMKESRFTPTSSLEEQIELESDVETFLWSTENRNVQFSSPGKLAIGGGCPKDDDNKDGDKKIDWGFGIALDGELYEGTSSPCSTFGDSTFGSPPLSKISPKGDIFEVSNMEVWTFTPCLSTDKAEQLEMGRMFVLSHF
eukprot:CAMPEP_0198261240 /NCGR_PEP_ID=MMETSP1447-20131203/10000_1 /TAXON_ID=420782 /ORGANISM="Chaetoceros dichaeta, Strain CCMP1751" /LENGTH=490 /DNA_ID=CAMNT_0043949093 /DNA_START=24 /DNA_END=1496 /DNA_ORIENTATION=+